MYCVSFQVFGILSDSINLCKYIVYDVLLQEFMKLRPRHGVYKDTAYAAIGNAYTRPEPGCRIFDAVNYMYKCICFIIKFQSSGRQFVT